MLEEPQKHNEKEINAGSPTKEEAEKSVETKKVEDETQKEETKGENAAPISNMPEAFKFALGKKLGMTQIFDRNGNLNSATMIDISSCRVAYVRQPEKDGYTAVALAYGTLKENNAKKPFSGICKKYGINPPRWIKEFRIGRTNLTEEVRPGQIVSPDRFREGDYVNVQGVSKGKGFAGVMKRHNFGGGPASHGASDRERAPGSISSRRSLGRVLPGQKMAGHMGQETVTMEKLRILKVEGDIVYVNGSVPGTRRSLVCILPTSKVVKKPVKTEAKGKKRK